MASVCWYLHDDQLGCGICHLCWCSVLRQGLEVLADIPGSARTGHTFSQLPVSENINILSHCHQCYIWHQNTAYHDLTRPWVCYYIMKYYRFSLSECFPNLPDGSLQRIAMKKQKNFYTKWLNTIGPRCLTTLQ